MALPLILAGISLGSQIAKGIKKNNLAKRRGRMAADLEKEGRQQEQNAWANRKDFNPSKVYESMDQQQSMLMNQMNNNTAGQAIQNRADARLANLASQSNRVSSTTGQAQAGLLAGIKAEQDAANQAALQNQQDKSQSIQMMMGLNAQRANLENMAYQYNVQDPFNLRFSQAMSNRNAGLQGRLSAENMRVSAFGDMMNGVGSAASSLLGGLGGPEAIFQKGGGLGFLNNTEVAVED